MMRSFDAPQLSELINVNGFQPSNRGSKQSVKESVHTIMELEIDDFTPDTRNIKGIPWWLVNDIANLSQEREGRRFQTKTDSFGPTALPASLPFTNVKNGTKQLLTNYYSNYSNELTKKSPFGGGSHHSHSPLTEAPLSKEKEEKLAKLESILSNSKYSKTEKLPKKVLRHQASRKEFSLPAVVSEANVEITNITLPVIINSHSDKRLHSCDYMPLSSDEKHYARSNLWSVFKITRYLGKLNQTYRLLVIKRRASARKIESMYRRWKWRRIVRIALDNARKKVPLSLILSMKKHKKIRGVRIILNLLASSQQCSSAILCKKFIAHTKTCQKTFRAFMKINQCRIDCLRRYWDRQEKLFRKVFANREKIQAIRERKENMKLILQKDNAVAHVKWAKLHNQVQFFMSVVDTVQYECIRVTEADKRRQSSKSLDQRPVRCGSASSSSAGGGTAQRHQTVKSQAQAQANSKPQSIAAQSNAVQDLLRRKQASREQYDKSFPQDQSQQTRLDTEEGEAAVGEDDTEDQELDDEGNVISSAQMKPDKIDRQVRDDLIRKYLRSKRRQHVNMLKSKNTTLRLKVSRGTVDENLAHAFLHSKSSAADMDDVDHQKSTASLDLIKAQLAGCAIASIPGVPVVTNTKKSVANIPVFKVLTDDSLGKSWKTIIEEAVTADILAKRQFFARVNNPQGGSALLLQLQHVQDAKDSLATDRSAAGKRKTKATRTSTSTSQAGTCPTTPRNPTTPRHPTSPRHHAVTVTGTATTTNAAGAAVANNVKPRPPSPSRPHSAKRPSRNVQS